MPNIINADNGVVSGFAGVRTTADGTGNLALQSNGVTLVTLATNNTVTISGTTSQTGNASFSNVTISGTSSTTGNASFANATFSGLLTALTANSGTSTTQVATTAFASGTLSGGGINGATGYQKLPSGLIIQYGTNVGSSPTTVTLPITFPNYYLGFPIITDGDYTNSSATCGAGSVSTSSFQLLTNSGGVYRWAWIFIGY
jgi:hypothetical protein